MEIDYKKLSAGLDELTGRDYADAEKQLRLLGEATGDLTFNKTFSAIIAAKILKYPWTIYKTCQLKIMWQLQLW